MSGFRFAEGECSQHSYKCGFQTGGAGGRFYVWDTREECLKREFVVVVAVVVVVVVVVIPILVVVLFLFLFLLLLLLVVVAVAAATAVDVDVDVVVDYNDDLTAPTLSSCLKHEVNFELLFCGCCCCFCC